jgi:hypothetical protein
MHLINDHNQHILTSRRERDLARLAEHNSAVSRAERDLVGTEISCAKGP